VRGRIVAAENGHCHKRSEAETWLYPLSASTAPGLYPGAQPTYRRTHAPSPLTRRRRTDRLGRMGRTAFRKRGVPTTTAPPQHRPEPRRAAAVPFSTDDGVCLGETSHEGRVRLDEALSECGVCLPCSETARRRHAAALCDGRTFPRGWGVCVPFAAGSGSRRTHALSLLTRPRRRDRLAWMGRVARVVVPDRPRHVTQRGNRRMRTFLRDDEAAERSGRYESTGRPLGDRSFLEAIGTFLGRDLVPKEPGRKPKTPKQGVCPPIVQGVCPPIVPDS